MVSDVAIVMALTGETVDSDTSWREWISEHYSGTALADLVEARRQAGQPWPFPVSSVDRSIGAAQWAALMRELVAELGLTRRSSMTLAADRPLTADERKLMDEVPPHHVR